MITNLSSIPNIKKYKTKNKKISDYLQTELSIPLLSMEDGYFYFVDNDKLQTALNKLPFSLKICA